MKLSKRIKHSALRSAVGLLERGRKAMQRREWEEGETQEAWDCAVGTFFAVLDARVDYESEMAEGSTMPELYYIQNRGYCGNCLQQWKAKNSGFTMDLDEAMKVTREEADAICVVRPGIDKAWPVDLINSCAARHVNCERLWEKARKTEEAPNA